MTFRPETVGAFSKWKNSMLIKTRARSKKEAAGDVIVENIHSPNNSAPRKGRVNRVINAADAPCPIANFLLARKDFQT